MSENTSSASAAKTASTGTSGDKPAAKSPPASTKKPRDIQNGKGDAPRNISTRFRSNYEGINWGGKRSKRKEV